MRVGTNPMARELAEPRRDIVISAITHLPNEDGYHAKRFDVIRLSLEAMRKHAGIKAHVCIWDNGSSRIFREWLQDEYQPDTLILSRNVGKSIARKSVFRMFNPSTTIAMADDDIYYYPGWLEPQLELMRHFPNVSAVTGYPLRVMFRWGCENTLRWCHENAQLEVGRFIPQQWEDDYAVSIGREIQDHRNLTLGDRDIRVTYRGKQAYPHAHHCQFVARAGKVEPIMQWDDSAMADEKPFDIALDGIGLRLATVARYTRHVGNVIDDGIRLEAVKHGLLKE